MKSRIKKAKKIYSLKPSFRPTNIEVILDEGVEEFKGNFIRMPIIDVKYDTNFIRIIIKDYRK